jgi:hypothetical protein
MPLYGIEKIAEPGLSEINKVSKAFKNLTSLIKASLELHKIPDNPRVKICISYYFR